MFHLYIGKRPNGILLKSFPDKEEAFTKRNTIGTDNCYVITDKENYDCDNLFLTVEKIRDCYMFPYRISFESKDEQQKNLQDIKKECLKEIQILQDILSHVERFIEIPTEK